MTFSERILQSRHQLVQDIPPPDPKPVREGGCGVVGVIASEPIPGGSLLNALAQMRNRGNGKGGGAAVTGLYSDWTDHYAIQLAVLDPRKAKEHKKEIENGFFKGAIRIDHTEHQPTVKDHESLGLDIRPPEVFRYFARAEESALEAFAKETGLPINRKLEEEFLSQLIFRLNKSCYFDPADPFAFILSCGRDMAIFKGVGYAEEVFRFYKLDELRAHTWIGHQRFPTRGRVWHPGGAHPFSAMNLALVHNGDFANYHSVTEHLRQRGLVPLFVTDTEVASLLMDLHLRILDYPLEHCIEALAPTSERDFEMLPKRTQRVYSAIAASHVHGAPDGPWFFIVARTNEPEGQPLVHELHGITDPSMLRPQVFALTGGKVWVGAIGSEKQAIDTVMGELHADNPDISPVADKYWFARGGSYTDGGAFVFRLRQARPEDNEHWEGLRMEVVDKFGSLVKPTRIKDQKPCPFGKIPPPSAEQTKVIIQSVKGAMGNGGAKSIYWDTSAAMQNWSYGEVDVFLEAINNNAKQSDENRRKALEGLTLLQNRHYNTGTLRRSSVLAQMNKAINTLLDDVPGIDGNSTSTLRRVTQKTTGALRPPEPDEDIIVFDATGHPPEGNRSVSHYICRATELGWHHIIVYRTSGDRFIGCGLGPNSHGIRIDVYGSSGDYLGSGLDGAEVHVHGSAQDQVGQILKDGKIVIHGDVGQCFLYGAKGGVAYVMGNTAGRPLINAVGRIRAIINGTSLDYLAESFMAGKETGDGFVLLNGLYHDERGNVIGLETKYPGCNLFSLASGGAGYINDPYHSLTPDQLNGADIVPFTHDDWTVVLPLLKENEEHFGITIDEDIQTVDGVHMWPEQVFRKVVPTRAELSFPAFD